MASSSWRGLLSRAQSRLLNFSSGSPISVLKEAQTQQQHGVPAASWLLARSSNEESHPRFQDAFLPLSQRDKLMPEVFRFIEKDSIPASRDCKFQATFPALKEEMSFLQQNHKAFNEVAMELQPGSSSSKDLSSCLMEFIDNLSHGKTELNSLGLNFENPGMCAPGFLGSDDITMEADSVKRKRKKKMNKHKHRKLRRLARKSKK